MKKIIIALIVIAVAGGVFVFLILKSGEKLNEASPLEETPSSANQPTVNDNLDAMDAQTRADFMAQVDAMRDDVMKKTEAMPKEARLVAQGDFMARFHGVSGRALLIQKDGRKILRFENFETDNGPNLHIYLSSDLGNDDFVDLGKIRATQGNVNYEIDAAIDTSRYSKVLVWCVPFGVLFSYAELQ